MKKLFFRITIVILVLVIGLEASLAYAQYYFNNRIFPNTSLSEYDLSYLSTEEAQAQISTLLNRYETTSLTISYEGTSHSFSLSDLGITLFTPPELLDEIPVMSTRNNPFSILKNSASTHVFSPLKSIDWSIFSDRLGKSFPTFYRSAQNAKIVFDRKYNLTIEPSHPGTTFDRAKMLRDIESIFLSGSKPALTLATTITLPHINDDDAKSFLPALSKKLKTRIRIVYERSEWNFALKDYLDVLAISFREYANIGGARIPLDFYDRSFDEVSGISSNKASTIIPNEASVFASYEVSRVSPNNTVSVEAVAVLSLPAETFLPKMEALIGKHFDIDPKDVTIQNNDGKISFDGTAQNGRILQKDLLVRSFEYAINHDLSQIELPVKEILASVNASDDLKNFGIQELIATGYSSFEGSPVNRIHNIKVGISKFNGVLVAPDEEFSFNKNLGEVDETTGYKKELVIREGNTIPEYGGGLCQVSSTAFRAALFGGLPITQRKAHSYAVSYYARPLGFGLDATIYPPYADLKFKNDTGAHILIQTYTEGTNAYFKFYGTSDHREVILDGPSIANKVPAPPDIVVTTDTLAPGEKKKVDSAHEGFDATWYRTVIQNGVPLPKDTFFSRYKAWPNKYLVGDETEKKS
ncbi:VanW family protein [Candidatus Peregrinibacteria bacterium]|nr:VanW family protein [Candidatus Peregrinibacteria bacterium]